MAADQHEASGWPPPSGPPVVRSAEPSTRRLMAVAGIAAVAGFAAFTGYQTLHVDASADRQQPATNVNSQTPADGAILPTNPDPRTGDRHGPPNGAQPSNPGQSQQSSSASS